MFFAFLDKAEAIVGVVSSARWGGAAASSISSAGRSLPPLLAESDDTPEARGADDDDESEDTAAPAFDLSRMGEEGSHDRIMYALGVNLARQIGDVRPLVENGEELTLVARGLLDTVVGRLDETGQRELLASVGKELDAVIVERA